MKTYLKFSLFGILGFGLLASRYAQADTTSPSDVEIVMYDLWLSTSTSCSNPVHVFSDPFAASQNIVSGPTFGSGSIPKGTYQCVVIGLKDNMISTPATSTTLGQCHAGVPITQQICRPPNFTQNPTTGATINCTNSPMEGYVYFSTTGNLANSNGNGGIWTPALPGPLAAPIVVTGDRNVTFVTNFDNQIVDDGSTCDCKAPVMSAF